jgi:hypothetical protein
VFSAEKSPFTTSVFVTAGYISSPGISIGAAPTVAVTNDNKSSSVGCLSIDNAPAATETVIENGVDVTPFVLEADIV